MIIEKRPTATMPRIGQTYRSLGKIMTIFAAGWIQKKQATTYSCVPGSAVRWRLTHSDGPAADGN